MIKEPMFSCQNSDCAEEVSYPANMLALWNGDPICEDCYNDVYFRKLVGKEDGPDYANLPPFIPEHEKRIAKLEAENKRLREIAEGMYPLEIGTAEKLHWRAETRKLLWSTEGGE